MSQSQTPSHSTLNSKAKIRSYLIGACLILALLISGYYWWMQVRFIEETDNAYVETDISHISTQVPGYITQIFVSDNQHVEKGQLLAQLEDDQYRAKVNKSQASVDSAVAGLSTLAAKVNLQQALITQAQASVRAAKAENVRAKQQLEREVQLKAKSYSSQDNVDQMRAASLSAKAHLAEAKAALVAKQRELTVYQAQKQEAEANLQQANAALELDQIKLKDTQIRAPFSGIIGKRGALAGQFVLPGQSLYSLVPDGAVWITANFKETQIQRMLPGQSVQVHLDAFPDKTFMGSIDSLSPASGSQFSLLPAENATGNFTKIVQRIPVKIRLALNELNDKVVPGLSAVVKVNTQQAVNDDSVIAKVAN
ncbi:HlyD family secretion protein [uncultured Shewanella sp.]|uniref:HlyD family secretion protein n=1 Tax=uncultured Shewanella sp. TaxID=173975 RepID=UPI0026276095|nr:HlyD family secretion protein [uncultured Shewanella sp.]